MYHKHILSVCIPSYNTERYIHDTIISVLNQTYSDFELIIVDDCSNDNTFEIVKSFDDPRIKAFRNIINIGAEKNWNKCLSLARGDYIKILPGDDTLYPACLEKQAAILNDPRNHDIVLVYCSRDVIDAYGKHVMQAQFPGKGRISRQVLVRKNIRHGMNVIGEPGAVLFRSAVAQKAGWFDARLPYLLDLTYWTKLLDHGDAFALRETLCTFRLSGNNWSFALGKNRRDNYISYIKKCIANKNYKINYTDVRFGIFRVYINELLRSILYLYLTRIRNT
ncbi:MAG TPA: glycosyltransferase [Desulfonatronum sp.]|nr:glycosyltransferase [Desulfonatronum sp.]